MAKNEQEYLIRIFNPRGLRTLKGTIRSMSVSDKVMNFTFKKPKSKNYATQAIPLDSVVAYTGAPGKPSTVTFWSRTVEMTIKGQIETKGDWTTVTESDGTIRNVRTSEMEAVADNTPAPEGAAAASGKKKKKKDKKG